VEAQRKLDKELAQVDAEKSTENKRYKAGKESINTSCQQHCIQGRTTSAKTSFLWQADDPLGRRRRDQGALVWGCDTAFWHSPLL
jgi:hypothetical protein